MSGMEIFGIVLMTPGILFGCSIIACLIYLIVTTWKQFWKEFLFILGLLSFLFGSAIFGDAYKMRIDAEAKSKKVEADDNR